MPPDEAVTGPRTERRPTAGHLVLLGLACCAALAAMVIAAGDRALLDPVEHARRVRFFFAAAALAFAALCLPVVVAVLTRRGTKPHARATGWGVIAVLLFALIAMAYVCNVYRHGVGCGPSC
jgi:drug/metabolite transporter (DMT)-like permease